MANFTDIIHGKEFNNLAAIFNVPFHSRRWKRDHPEVPFWSLWRDFDKVTPPGSDLNKEQILEAFTNLLIAITEADPELAFYTEADTDWFVSVLDGSLTGVTLNLFKAWVSAAHEFLTPGELAELTGKSESNWRNRAAGQPGYKPIPGCRKPGKDWLIPLAVLQAQGEVSWDYRQPPKNHIIRRGDVV